MSDLDKKVVGQLFDQMNRIENTLESMQSSNETLLTSEDSAAFLGMSLDSFRRKHTLIAPSYKVAKRLMFKKSDLVKGIESFKAYQTQHEIKDNVRRRLDGENLQ